MDVRVDHSPGEAAVDGRRQALALRRRREKFYASNLGPRHRRLRRLQRMAALVLKATGFYGRGVRNAARIGLERVTVPCQGLDPALDGYTILQVSDLHLDNLAATADAALACVTGLTADLCVLTGDYVHDSAHGEACLDRFLPALSAVMTARHGFYAVLGNHDAAPMIAVLERHGVNTLLNESVILAETGDRLCLTGLDDVHRFHTAAAPAALEAAPLLAPDAFHVALVHSPEMADTAARAGFGLYLSGHTHGGQICWPGGRAIVSNLYGGHGFVSGRWRSGPMVGYTSRGAGVSRPPVRFNCPPEVTLFTLRRATTNT
jgi:predicted MPP superfamily phosphohydrolase